MMKMVDISGKMQARVIEVPEPQPVRNWVKIKVTAAPMCTEVKGFVAGDGGHGYGHEAAGEVVEVAQPCMVKSGDRVVVQPATPCGICALCRSGEYIHCQHFVDFREFSGFNYGQATMAQYLLKADWLCSPIPDDVDDDLASMAICGLGPSFGAFQRMNLNAFDTVLITGLGPVGLGAVVNAVYRGARVIGVESNDYRISLAKRLGATEVLNPSDEETLNRILELTGGIGVDKSLDCSGTIPAHRLCIDAARRMGEVAFVGQCHQDTPLCISRDMINKGLTLHGAWHYNIADYPAVMQVIRQSPLIAELITHRFPIDQIQQAWELQVSGNCGKVILKPWS